MFCSYFIRALKLLYSRNFGETSYKVFVDLSFSPVLTSIYRSIFFSTLIFALGHDEWVEIAARESLKWPSTRLTDAPRWSWTLWTLQDCELIVPTGTKQQPEPLPLCFPVHGSLGGGTACTVYFVFLTNIQQLCWYFLVIQCCRKSGKYTPAPHKSEKKKCVPFENKAQGFIFFILFHICFYLWFSSPRCTWLNAYAVCFRGSLNWNWTHRHHRDVEESQSIVTVSNVGFMTTKGQQGRKYWTA